MKTASEITNDLQNFYGTEHYYAYRALGFPNLKLTDGVKYLAEAAECYWLLEIVASVGKKLRAKDHFHVITLKADGKGGATFTADDGNGNIHHTQKLEYSSFPLPEIKLYFIDDVLLLVSEY